ncbi:hypothetical protein BO70DRAFT_379139 [Aspergillus heteromorphus CBS 117.55]|uniref:Ig-like domain-containing protein n=1 Tax=Aspergillus heteromorphus CBS 117.55 TaxID=1448321 RepID=A0A317WID5_9EURO|nr:uncharacterized protein BO70DRAFT_379139 [Aspergillus heteromorphus CBS 117.55]PWY85042.1 hypothetical protein BO70DRAFT_379139 [Aspergillus heteromorphus CBS 117.55]
MHPFQTLSLAALAATLALAADPVPTQTPLPTVHIGTIQTCGTNKYGPDYLIWLDSQSPCNGTDLGIVNSYRDYGLCELTAPIPGYPNLMFSGCTERVTPYGQAGAPASISENGNVVMQCQQVGPRQTECPSPCGGGQSVQVTANYTCSAVQNS